MNICKSIFIIVFSLVIQLPCYAQEPKILNLYTWGNNIDPKVLELFQKETGIIVRYDTYDNDEVLEAKLLAGKSAYDIVSPSATPYFARQIILKNNAKPLFLPLDKNKLTNWHHLNPRILQILSSIDPKNIYGVPFTWGTTGFGYNVQKIKELLPKGAPIHSIKMLFDPKILKKLTVCGVDLLDNPKEVIEGALMYLGYPIDSKNPAHFEEAIEILKTIRPYIRHFNASSERTINRLVNSEICISQGWSGEILKAREEAKELGRPFEIAYILPEEGGGAWIDVLAIPIDAPHPENAHLFLNFLLRPEIAVINVMYNLQSTPNKTAISLLPENIRNDPIINPPLSVLEKIYLPGVIPLETARAQVRAFLKIKMGGHPLTEPLFIKIYKKILEKLQSLKQVFYKKT